MIGAGETAIQARLQAAGDAGILGYKWATIESYPADWDAYFKDKAPRAPGTWVVFAGFSKGEVVGFGGLRAEAHYGVVVMAENARNETAQRQGGPTPAEPGSYQLAEDVIGLLHGQDLGVFAGAIEVRACHPVRTLEITKARKISMYAVELAVPLGFQAGSVGLAAGELPAAIGDFSDFHVDWDVPPIAVVPPLPDDAHADAVDDVSLEPAP